MTLVQVYILQNAIDLSSNELKDVQLKENYQSKASIAHCNHKFVRYTRMQVNDLLTVFITNFSRGHDRRITGVFQRPM